MAFELYDFVTIKHPLFEGCSGVVTGASGSLFCVSFTDFEDHVDKQVYFEPDQLIKHQTI